MPPSPRRRPVLTPAAADALRSAAQHVDEAKAALLATVPSPRGAPGTPLAEGLARFEVALGRADAVMEGWRGTDPAWQACRSGLDEAMGAAERLRLEAPELDYEALVGVLAGLMDPLGPFEDAERALLGRR